MRHFENGAWMYRGDCIPDIRRDFAGTFSKSIHVGETMVKKGMIQRLICTLIKMFAPML